MITLDSIFSAGIHQNCGTLDIGIQEDLRILDGTVNMAFCREVHDDIRVLLFK